MAQLYVISCPARSGVKIGYSKEPSIRAKTISRFVGSPVITAFLSEPCDCAPEAEALAHWRLRDRHIGGEWFEVGADAAQEAIEGAIADATAGERAPCRIGFASPLAARKTERLAVEIDGELAAALDDWRADQRIWSRSEAVRQLIKLAISADA